MVVFHLLPFIKGFITGAGLIIAIGAQNAFILKQAILRNHVFLIAALCSLIDSCLIFLGVFGFASIIESHPMLLMLAKWGGFAFLGYYGFRSFRSVLNPHAMTMDRSQSKPSLGRIVSLTLAFSLLNPHVYLDSIVLLGSIGSQFSDAEQPSFAIGAILASCVWFFSLGYGAKLLAPLFTKPAAWQILDFIVGCLMWSIAVAVIL